jgi:hypothetical protein
LDQRAIAGLKACPRKVVSVGLEEIAKELDNNRGYGGEDEACAGQPLEAKDSLALESPQK